MACVSRAYGLNTSWFKCDGDVKDFCGMSLIIKCNTCGYKLEVWALGYCNSGCRRIKDLKSEV